MILFLDFDGVLHPQRDGDTVPADKAFCYLPRLEGVLRDYPHVEIVISSTWRNQFDLAELKARFSEDLQSRIIGVTPNVETEHWQPLQREREILAWLQAHHREAAPWVALDDAAWQFRDYVANLVPCSWYVGFDDEAELALRAKLATILFLDFDGVLHPFADRHNPAAQFVYLPRLEAALRTMPQVLIVIASDWRERHDLAQLRGFFSSDIAARIIGVTPSHEIDASSAQSWIGCRQNEAMSYLAAAGLSGPWVALDDTPEGWQAGAPLVVCADGFGEGEAQALHRFVSLMSGVHHRRGDVIL